MIKHKYSELIIAKALNMSLVIFHKSEHQNVGNWWAFESDVEIMPSFEGEYYFACLPQYADECLKWLNGSEIEFCRKDESVYKPLGDHKVWSTASVWMEQDVTFRAKPELILEDDEFYKFNHGAWCFVMPYDANKKVFENAHGSFDPETCYHIQRMVVADE